MFSCWICKISKNNFFREHVYATNSMWAVFLEYIFLLKVCFETITLAKKPTIFITMAFISLQFFKLFKVSGICE